MGERLIVYRVQDIEGRGPYRPGFSHTWVADHGPAKPPSWIDEFGMGLLKKARPHEALGCAFRTLEQARKWFLQEELDRLVLLGYRLVKMDVDRVLAESEHQLVIARSKPLALDVETVE